MIIVYSVKDQEWYLVSWLGLFLSRGHVKEIWKIEIKDTKHENEYKLIEIEEKENIKKNWRKA